MSDKEYIEMARATHDQDRHGRDFDSCQYGECKAANLLEKVATLQAQADASAGLAEQSEALHARYVEWIQAQSEEIKIGTALKFGSEYSDWVDALEAYRKAMGG